MEITVEDFLAEVDHEYSGLTFTNVDGAPLTLRSPVRLGTDTLKRIDKYQTELDAIQASEGETDYDTARSLLVDILALAADRPDALRSLVAGWDIGTLRMLTQKWTKETQGEAPAQ